jgi:hypothetical protein
LPQDATRRHVAHPELDQIAPARLCIYGAIEHR